MRYKLAYIFFVCSLFLCCNICYGQQNQKLDSLIDLYENTINGIEKADLLNKIIQLELYNNPEKAKSYIIELLKLSKNINYKTGEANAYYRLGGYYYNQDKLDSAEIYFKKASFINIKMNNVSGILNDHVEIALLFIRRFEYDSALFYLNKNIQSYYNRDSNSTKVEQAYQYIGSTFHTISSAYSDMGMYKLALKFEYAALKLYQKLGDQLFIADAKNSLSSIEYKLGNFKEALFYVEDALKIYKSKNDAFFQVLAINNKGIALDGMKKYTLAIETYKKGIMLAKSNSYEGRLALIWSNMGNSYSKLNQ